MRLGVHVSIAGGLARSVERATALSCTAMQCFSRSPRSWQCPPLPPDAVQAFRERRGSADLRPVAVHCPYLINLASPDETLWPRSVEAACRDLERAEALGADCWVLHVGSHRGSGEAAGIARVSRALQQLRQVRRTTVILLENTAGSGDGLGFRFEHLRAMLDGAGGADGAFGICLDTAHTFAAGYPIHTPDGLDATVRAFDQTIGLERLRLIHLNDSKAPFHSGVDRHWHIGEGAIGLPAFGRFVNHPAFRELPFILETPKESEAEDRWNLAVVRRLRKSTGARARASPPPLPRRRNLAGARRAQAGR